MRIMITGAEGFIGGVLARHCVEQGESVLGIGIGTPPPELACDFAHADVCDEARLSRILASFRPDRIFHLAAQSYPTVSLTAPRQTMETNAGGTINLFECLRSLHLMPPVVVACSSAEYGPVAAGDLPVRETHPLRPLHPYGVSKVAQDLLTAQYVANYGFPALRIRIFNTT
jgi:GDP-4-dehydro-6-deoxy-D-mannose reductase